MSFPFDLHSAAPPDSQLPCRAHAVLLKATAQHGRLSTAVLCRGLEKNGNGQSMAWARHGKCESGGAALCKSNGKDILNP